MRKGFISIIAALACFVIAFAAVTPTQSVRVTNTPTVVNGGGTVTLSGTSAVSLGSISINGTVPVSLGSISLTSSSANIGSVTLAGTSPVSLGSLSLGSSSLNIGSVTLAGTSAVSLGSIAINGSIPAGVNNIGSVSIAGTVPVSLGSIALSGTSPVSLGSISINGAVPAGANNIGSVSVAGTVPVSLASITLNGTSAVSIGSLTANIGTTNGLALDATLTGGTQKAIARTAAKGTTVAADLTSTPVDANTQALDVSNKTSLPAGSNNIGSVTLAGTSAVSLGSVSINGAIPIGTNNIGSVTLAGTSAVSLASITLNTGGNNVGSVTLAASSNNVGSVTLNTGANVIGAVTQSGAFTVTQQSITKGTQGSAGVTTQDLKDAGRANFTFYAQRATGVGTEALISLTQTKDGVSTSSVTSYTITSGKRFRMQALYVTFIQSSATALTLQLNIRYNPSGAATAASPIVFPVDMGFAIGTNAQGVQASDTLQINFPDGLDFPSGGQFGISQITKNAAGTGTAGGTITVALLGYEY